MRVLLALGVLCFVAQVQSQGGLPEHYPKYLKSGKYGQAFANWKSYEGGNYMTKNVGTKTGVKTSYRAPAQDCKERPKPAPNTKLVCTLYSGCRASCLPGHQFPNGETQVFIKCIEGEWKIEHSDWTTLPACQPTCMPACQNTGICIAPNRCHCPETFVGPQCQYPNKPCLNYPPLPSNSRRTCSSKTCTISCLPGHKFPDGSALTNMNCVNGQWMTTRDDWKSVPDCRPTCTPECRNGGICLSFNVCQCPKEFRGPQCQYNADACNAHKLRFNGGFNCSGDATGFSCSISCPEGGTFEFEPAPVYQCTYDKGAFYPQPVPQCKFGKIVEVLPHPDPKTFFAPLGSKIPVDIASLTGGSYSSSWIKKSKNIPDSPLVPVNTSEMLGGIRRDFGGYSTPVGVVLEKGQPRAGSCFTWGGRHVKTFDGKVYSFESPCAHTLVRDNVDNTFSIVIQQSPNCDENYCSKIIKIFLQDREYILERPSQDAPPKFSHSGKILPLPSATPGLRAELSAHHIVISLEAVGLSIRWDGKQMIQILANAALWNRTAGLCGVLDGNDEDFINKKGDKSPTVESFVDSWQVDTLENSICTSSPSLTHGCENTVHGAKAADFCHRLLKDKRFSACHLVVDVTTLLNACRWDYCSCASSTDPQQCGCQTVEMYVRECRHKGVKIKEWRDENICPIQCTGGRIYTSCGPSLGRQQVCGAVSEEPTPDPEDCEEGCYCPKGTVLHDGECITVDRCPCRLRGKSFPPGASVPKDCNKCKCEGGLWQCTQVSCGARCSAIGDPHYQTFDGKKFDFMGQCSYTLVKTSDYSIEAENVACSGSISQAMNLPPSLSTGLPSCTKAVKVRIPGGHVVKLKQNHEVSVNGKEVTELPYELDGATIRVVSSIFTIVEFMDGLEIWWDGMTRAYIEVPAEYKGTTKGLCGTFNNNQNDDFLTPEGDVEKGVVPFANKWKTSEQCQDVSDVQKSHPCDVNVHNKAAAEKHCAKLKSDLFAGCHWYVDPLIFYLDCLYDMCSCGTKVSQCLCPILSAYAKECADKGVIVEYRKEVRECGIQCPPTQHYLMCGNSCTRSCADISLKPNCKQTCVEGCNCPEGLTLDEHGECIPIGTCSCRQNGLQFPPGYKEIRSGTKGQQLCECMNAIWDCRPATPPEILKYPASSDLQTVCSATRNQEFTTCEAVEPITCRNMHIYQPTSPAICRPGCKCKKGYVLDSGSRECVKMEECPCHHGGKSYTEGEEIQNDCNTCKCGKGKWKCTKRACPGQCSAWGDSHYKTFDGRMFDYQGQCDYILAKGSLSKDETFDITIQNVPCSTLGVACSKSVTVKIAGESLILTRDKSLPDYTLLKQMSVRTAPTLVVIESETLGLVVHWDRGTRVYVRLDPKWKGRVKGLCGNYNDDQMDDFQTPSGGISEVSSQLFGDSWRLQSYCAEAVEITDTCEERPDRKLWAHKRCSVLKSPLFASCHSELDVTPYMERCVFDTCACDQGGDCECLCTALAAYAHECNARGVPVKWRSQELCPMQCDENCAKYTPCMSTCAPQTCDNLHVHSQLGSLCTQDVCVEGCAPKPCPPDQVLLNSTGQECIPKADCPKPLCMEVPGVGTYYEGDVMEEDDCHKCFCSMGKKTCQGTPCTTPSSEFFSTKPSQNEQLVQCKNGWTEWINQDIHRIVNSAKGKSRGQPTDTEPLPSALILNSLKGATCSESQMIDIECRTVQNHESAKETGLDVECSLERGLICVAQPGKGQRLCPDFEIRVLCQCQRPTTPAPYVPCDPTQPNKEHESDCHAFYHCTEGVLGPELVEKNCGPNMMYNPETQVCDWPATVLSLKPICGVTKPAEESEEVIIEATATSKCPPDQEYSHCAIECQRLCMFYSYVVKERGQCDHGQVCDEGCVHAERRTSCPPGMLWRDNATCVQISDCTCRSHNGTPVKPGTVFSESPCEFCQCIDNHYVCDSSSCKTTPAPPTTTPESLEVWSETTPAGVGVSTLTPPNECDDNLYIDLIEGDIPLADEAFSASSILTPAFAPKAARFNSKVTDKSAGAWSPAESNKNQYLQIILPQVEPIYGLVLKGSPLYDQYVTGYHVLHSLDGLRFNYITEEGNPEAPKLFRGPIDHREEMKQMFEPPIEAKVLRISPQTWHDTIAMQVEIIGCGKQKTTPQFRTTIKPLCDDPMGLENGDMWPDLLSVSSEKPNHSKEDLKLSSLNAWQPLANSPTEWVQLDFSAPRNITGLETKGGPNGWVSAYSVEYSHDNKNWNPILDDYSNEMTFLGNYDHDTPHTNYFKRPLQTKYIKIQPKKWKDNIQMRIEPLGCYEEYIRPRKKAIKKKKTLCNVCPDVPITSKLTGCKCDNLWWDGENCVNRAQCPCMVGHIPYAVGTTYETESCSQCLCKLHGVPQCKKKQCDKCPMGMRSVLTPTCGCICQPCPPGQILCPTSDICIDKEAWCNGVQDCPDDEQNCPETTTQKIATIEPLIQTTKIMTMETQACPRVECPPGYKVQLIKLQNDQPSQNLSPMFYMYTGRHGTASKGGSTKSAWAKGKWAKKTILPKKYVEEQQQSVSQKLEDKEARCQEFKCTSTWMPPPPGAPPPKPCPVPKCPPGYKIAYEQGDMNNPSACRQYECIPPPPKDTTCTVMGRTFTTFDGTEYKYDICEHVLVRDLEYGDWEVLLVKDCPGGDAACARDLVVKHGEEIVTLMPDLSVEFNGYRYTVAQTKKIGAKNKSFVVSRLGDTLLFVSNHYGFWVMWDKFGNVKVGVTSKLLNKIDGLCGLYNHLSFDDKRLPDGRPARTTPEFGDAWFVGERPCEIRTCPQELQDRAWAMCNSVKHHTLAACHGSVDVERFVSRCLEVACECLEGSGKNGTTDDWCRCQVLESFVVECLMKSNDIELSDWRVQHECPAVCPPPLVHHDCYRRRCEPSCSNLQETDPCPAAQDICFPGCYCPPGTVRKHQACVPARQCRDCECNLLPNLKYVQFDGRNVTVDTNCSYVMVRDKLDVKEDLIEGVKKGVKAGVKGRKIGRMKEKKHSFQVIVSNAPCAQNPNKMCPDVITLLYQDERITVERSSDMKHLQVALNDAEVMHLPFEADGWIEIKERAAKHINILLPKIQLELTVYYPTLGASIKLPSHTYSSRIEGLCGNCNRDSKDDNQRPDGSPVNTIEELTHSWLHGDASECYREKLPECEEVKEEEDPCRTLLDQEKFGQCHMLLSPAIFLETCQRDICGGMKDQACISLETYAAGCAANGLCVDWHIPQCPAKTCPAEQTYQLCGSACAPTCDNYKIVGKKVCPIIPTEGCFCPEGRVMRNGTCVEPRFCEVCDKEGHHPGDKWKVDDCTSCECQIDSGQVRCQTQQCPALETVCEHGYSSMKIDAQEGECCPKYLCLPVTVSPTCETPQKLSCGYGQVMKLDTRPDGCQKFVCQCVPPEDCPPLETPPTDLPPGMVQSIDKSGCCPLAKTECKPELCPAPKACPKFYSLTKHKGKDDCCVSYTCEPPKDKCLYEMKYKEGAVGGARDRSDLEKEVVAKEPNSMWNDGPCLQCKCVESAPVSNGNMNQEASTVSYQPVCSEEECNSLTEHPDREDYDLMEEPVKGQCCPTVIKVKCKHHGKFYKVGENWTLDNPCKTSECIQTPQGLQKQLKIQTCNKECEPGYEYEQPSSDKCCGGCVQTSCITDGTLHRPGDQWVSPDHCTKYQCVNGNGNLQVKSEVETCKTLPQDWKNNFDVEFIKKKDECCGEWIKKACKVKGKIYKVGETWPDPLGDKCKNYTCIKSPTGDITKQNTIKTCNTACAKGWEYRPAPVTSPECCGECVPTHCVVNETLYTPGETWKSNDGCISYECTPQDHALSVTTSQKTCPSLANCPPENIYSDGCCKMCNITSGALSQCTPVEVPQLKTLGLIKFTREPHGLCWNGGMIKGFTECRGTCNSGTLYNQKTGAHESACTCCQAFKFTSLTVSLQCEDGYKFNKVVAVPSECGCGGCSKPVKEGVKTGVKH